MKRRELITLLAITRRWRGRALLVRNSRAFPSLDI
jgi:hypothetical protein